MENKTTTPIAQPVEAEVHDIIDYQIPEIVEKLPYESWHHFDLSQDRRGWCFHFECNFGTGRFSTTVYGQTPKEAFAIGKHMIMVQVNDWHKTRFDEKTTASGPLADFASRLHPDAPRVLIVDDDVDLALAMETALNQMGYRTEIATQHEGLHQKIIDSNADYIFLDWKLNDKVTAGQVVDRVVRRINTFSDLREKFTQHPPRVITYSVLERKDVALPAGGDKYFTHVDHWQKPLAFHEVIERASELMNMNRQGGKNETVAA